MSTALITGSSGHVGSNLIRKLTELDYEIRCIDFEGDHRAYEGFDVELMKEILQIKKHFMTYLVGWI